MFNLIRLYDGSYVLKTASNMLHLSFSRMIAHLVNDLGVEPSELNIAVAEMFKNDHNTAHFGIHKGFIFTRQIEMPTPADWDNGSMQGVA